MGIFSFFSKSKVSESTPKGGKDGGSVIDKLTEAQLDEFREAFNSFDKVRASAGCPPVPARSFVSRPRGLHALARRMAAAASMQRS